MTVETMIRLITDVEIVETKGDSSYLSTAIQEMGGVYLVDQKSILISDKDATDGRSLAIAAHEAFHAKRHAEGVRFYSLQGFLVSNLTATAIAKSLAVGVARVAEEHAVNALTEPFVMRLFDEGILPECERPAAEQLFATSKKGYSWDYQLMAAGMELWKHLPMLSSILLRRLSGRKSIQKEIEETMEAALTGLDEQQALDDWASGEEEWRELQKAQNNPLQLSESLTDLGGL